jgi:hypothetical protein
MGTDSDIAAELQRQNSRLHLLLSLTNRITSNLDLRENAARDRSQYS